MSPSDKKPPRRRKPATEVVHAGRDPQACYGFVNPPVYRGSTVLFPTVEKLWKRDQAYTYGRTSTPTVRALEEAIAIINRDKRAAAKLYVKASKSKEPVDVIYGYLTKQPLSYTTTPLNITKYSDFMYQTGSIKIKPKNWKDLFFPNVHGKQGS